MKKLGNIFHTRAGLRVVLGSLSADLEHGKRAPLVGLDLAAVLPLCRAVGGTVAAVGGGERQIISAVCIPYENIQHPPYICCDIMYDKTKTPVKMGWVSSKDEEKGKMYLVWLDVAAFLKRWDIMFMHLHEPTSEELTERLGK